MPNTCPTWGHEGLCYFVLYCSFILGTILFFFFLIQLRTEKKFKKVAKIPYFFHRIGAITSLGLYGFGINIFEGCELIGKFISNLNGQIQLWTLGIISLFLIETLNEISRTHTFPYLRKIYLFQGILIIFFTILAFVGVHIYRILFLQVIADIYYLFYGWISVILICYRKYRLQEMIEEIYSNLKLGPQKTAKMKELTTIKWKMLCIIILTILASVYYITRISGDIKGEISSENNPEKSIGFVFFIEGGIVIVTLWYGWIPILGPSQQLSQSGKISFREQADMANSNHKKNSNEGAMDSPPSSPTSLNNTNNFNAVEMDTI